MSARCQLSMRGFSSTDTCGYTRKSTILLSVQDKPLSQPVTTTRDRLEERLARLTARDKDERVFVKLYT